MNHLRGLVYPLHDIPANVVADVGAALIEADLSDVSDSHSPSPQTEATLISARLNPYETLRTTVRSIGRLELASCRVGDMMAITGWRKTSQELGLIGGSAGSKAILGYPEDIKAHIESSGLPHEFADTLLTA